MEPPFTVEPIGWVHGTRAEPLDDRWGEEIAEIRLAPRFTADTFAGLAEFSHVEVLFLFHLVEEAEINASARRPRGRADWPLVGIFAQRGKGRPNRIGMTTCEVVAVEGTTLTVRGLDAIDGTPVLDIKPYMVEFGPRGEVREPDWARELMAEYW